ncbi:hypothetical protein PS2_090 [Serratia phage PS2]|uniref:Uncharacterized protein n=1 Tax=Serratia phage PS2 TaxID=1481112 RepID=A0A023W6H2_9CAUD|nr:hypothetical protein FF83_gp090 [Serratia phage PS2]AHY25337.1 hypothetical protein PS2_090 [Serratia phage PS2]
MKHTKFRASRKHLTVEEITGMISRIDGWLSTETDERSIRVHKAVRAQYLAKLNEAKRAFAETVGRKK